MCGIAGIIGKHNDSTILLKSLLSKISHRGESLYQHEIDLSLDHAIGTNRLGIIDEQHGKQPFKYKDEVVCILNGQIYNHAYLREELSKFYPFKTNNDTEVVLMSYMHWGMNFVKYLDGMFAVCIIDVKNKRSVLARDHIGIKPLYYSYHDNNVFFSSELKSFQDLPFISEIKALNPGTIWVNRKIITYYKVPLYNFSKKHSNSFLLNELKKLLTDAVSKQISLNTKKVACLLSGGIDSSIILYIASKLHKNIEAFTLATSGGISKDLVGAKKLCQHLNIKHTVVSPQEKELQHFYLTHGVYIAESYEPVLVRNAVSYHFVCKTVKKMGYKYVLNGEGADELFGGYDYFKRLPTQRRDAAIRNSLLHLHQTYLHMADRASMYATVEARVPYLDKDFINFCMKLPPSFRIAANDIDKWGLRESFKNNLPEYIVQKPKVGMTEGAGFGKNKPGEGIYYKAVEEYYNKNNHQLESDRFLCKSYSRKFNISQDNIEEVYNFARFIENGFHKLLKSNLRVHLNT